MNSEATDAVVRHATEHAEHVIQLVKADLGRPGVEIATEVKAQPRFVTGFADVWLRARREELPNEVWEEYEVRFSSLLKRANVEFLQLRHLPLNEHTVGVPCSSVEVVDLDRWEWTAGRTSTPGVLIAGDMPHELQEKLVRRKRSLLDRLRHVVSGD